MSTFPRSGRSVPRGLARGVVLALAVVAVVLGLAPPAGAHVALVRATPADGAQIAAFPAEVRLTFNQSISPPAYVIVTAPDGRALGRGDVLVDGPTLRVRTQTSTTPGRYAIAYRVVSEDGHPLSGQLFSEVAGGPRGQAGSGKPAEAADDGEPVAPGAVAGRSPMPGDRISAGSRTLLVSLVAGVLAVLAVALAAWSTRFAR